MFEQLKKIFILFLIMCICVHMYGGGGSVCACDVGACGGQKRELDPLELEL